jgi:phospholipase C
VKNQACPLLWLIQCQPTNPNRAYIVSGTSAGHGTNDAGFGQHALTQLSIFEKLTELNITWTNYATSGGGDALYFNWTETSAAATKNLKTLDEFFQDAYLGRLPQFTYVNPSCCGVGTNSMHPTGLVSDGEVLLKQLYDSLRNGPQWGNTLFIITFDETGGFHDHIQPPLAPRPDNLSYTEATPDGGSYTFNFDRLGGRLPTWIISPWVESGYVEKLGTNSAGQTIPYSATSILRTLGYLWDFEPFNPRVAWSPSFDHLIQTRLNKDTPSIMPNPTTF